MQLDITTRNYEPSKRVRDTVDEKAQKFLKYADIDRVRVTLTGEHVELFCEIHLHCMGKDFHAKASSEDMLNSVDKAAASMEKALRRYKSKREDARKGLDQRGVSSAAVLEASVRAEADRGDEDHEEI